MHINIIATYTKKDLGRYNLNMGEI